MPKSDNAKKNFIYKWLATKNDIWRRSTTLSPSEEGTINHNYTTDNYVTIQPFEREGRRDRFKESIHSFELLPEEDINVAAHYQVKYNEGNDDRLVWEILPENVHI